jgi:hypothetical protein
MPFSKNDAYTPGLVSQPYSEVVGHGSNLLAWPLRFLHIGRSGSNRWFPRLAGSDVIGYYCRQRWFCYGWVMVKIIIIRKWNVTAICSSSNKLQKSVGFTGKGRIPFVRYILKLWKCELRLLAAITLQCSFWSRGFLLTFVFVLLYSIK